MNEFEFAVEEEVFVAVNAGWSDNGCDVYDIIRKSDESFVDSITVHPINGVEDTVATWKSSAQYFV